jgi:hypothetical protein
MCALPAVPTAAFRKLLDPALKGLNPLLIHRFMMSPAVVSQEN